LGSVCSRRGVESEVSLLCLPPFIIERRSRAELYRDLRPIPVLSYDLALLALFVNVRANRAEEEPDEQQ
jgi:hypothetical protein